MKTGIFVFNTSSNARKYNRLYIRKYIFYCKTKINLDLSEHPIYALSINDEID